MYEITNRLDAPYSSICYIECQWSDGTATRASGVVVGYNDVLTALHVVFEADHGGWASQVTIVPAADTQPWQAPVGEFTNVGTLDGRASNWDLNGDGYLTQAESAGDLALIGMTSRIGDVTGWLPVSQQPADFYGLMSGYPAVGTGLMAEPVFADASSTESVYNISSNLGPGASGGPLLATVNGVTSVVGVLSGGTSYSATYAGLFSSATWNWLQGALAANDTLLGYLLPTSVVTATGTIFTGSAGDDVLTGHTGWDVFTGGGGNDVLDGGAGIDTATYSAVRSAYTVTAATGTLTITDSVAGRDGSDTLHGIERVKFADVSLAFDVGGSAGEAYRLYQTAFNRTPDAAGLGFQMKALDDGWALAQIAGNFISSPEFQRSFGNLTDAQFVNQLYLYALGRAADDAGFAYHTANLASGANSRADLVAAFSESPEHQEMLVGVLQNGMVYTG
jgi:V8-like Glu-specific endopeptidase